MQGPSISSKKGFTLIEALIAVSLTALVLGALYAGFFSVIRGQRTIEAELERAREISRFLDTFSNEARSAFFKDNETALFRGEFKMGKKGDDMSDIAFTSFVYPITSESRPVGDVLAIRYFTEEKDGLTILYKETWNPFAKDPDSSKFRAEAIEDISGFEVRYFNGAEWAKAWDAQKDKNLPTAVKALVRVTDEGEVKEFTTTARLMVR